MRYLNLGCLLKWKTDYIIFFSSQKSCLFSLLPLYLIFVKYKIKCISHTHLYIKEKTLHKSWTDLMILYTKNNFQFNKILYLCLRLRSSLLDAGISTNGWKKLSLLSTNNYWKSEIDNSRKGINFRLLS